jgi:hypothetical protein
VEFYKLVLDLIDLRSFSNLWYWIMLAVVWSSASHWVMGVPFDLIRRAQRLGGDAVHDLEMLVRINCDRLLNIADTSGMWLTGFVSFMLTGLVTLGWVYDVEFAQAVALIALPATVLGMMALRTARLIAAGEGQGAALFRRLARHRFATQVLGMLAIFVTSLFGMYHNMNVGVLGN